MSESDEESMVSTERTCVSGKVIFGKYRMVLINKWTDYTTDEDKDDEIEEDGEEDEDEYDEEEDDVSRKTKKH